MSTGPAPGITRRARTPRLLIAAGAGLVGLLVVVASVGLLATPVGAGDNGDGRRLFCGAGLAPLTPDGGSSWKGGLVLDFATGAPVCADPTVSSALPLLQLAAVGAGPTWSLTRLGVLYALMIGLATAVAAWAVAGTQRSRLLILVPALIPLAGPTFSRFFLSTYGEPAGLLGASVLLLGLGVLSVTERELRAERVAGLVLTAAGGVVAATAKASYAPLLLVAVIVCAASVLRLPARPAAHDHLAGFVAAVVAVLLAQGPLLSGMQWQQRHFAVVNTQNLVFTTVLPAVDDKSVTELGMPAASAEFAGRAYYPEGASGYPGSEVIAARPAQLRSAAYQLLLTHPVDALRAFGIGLRSTLGADLEYLPSEPVTPGTIAPVLGTTVGQQGADRDQLLAWLHGLPAPWLPGLVMLAGVGLGAFCRRGTTVVAALGRIAAIASIAAAGLVVVAVLGDGYFEIAKHTWLAAYLLSVTAVALLLAAVVGVIGLVARGEEGAR